MEIKLWQVGVGFITLVNAHVEINVTDFPNLAIVENIEGLLQFPNQSNNQSMARISAASKPGNH